MSVRKVDPVEPGRRSVVSRLKYEVQCLMHTVLMWGRSRSQEDIPNFEIHCILDIEAHGVILSLPQILGGENGVPIDLLLAGQLGSLRHLNRVLLSGI